MASPLLICDRDGTLVDFQPSTAKALRHAGWGYGSHKPEPMMIVVLRPERYPGRICQGRGSEANSWVSY